MWKTKVKIMLECDFCGRNFNHDIYGDRRFDIASTAEAEGWEWEGSLVRCPYCQDVRMEIVSKKGK